ncbi:2-C-methyl-D-erythritol 2,4-cyclodiphosphate synthase [Candidatus Palauibacter sp.]|uniref:2-C-methyl-D-erythritol 2,4-cyclodiphosphate synthase n=1 Tax=Candidatus Palauibacter sp. TaxID=3101350 RepID=UPI003AF29752
MRAGVGYDSHRFDETRPLVLGGVTIPNTPGLKGHSDGDAVAHAVTDAVLGAVGLGDIGAMFPDTDPAHEGADSIGLLAAAVRRLRDDGFHVGNVDVTIVTERPRIAPHAAAMRERLAEALQVPASAVSIKGKSNEGLGWIGRGEGLAAIAVAAVAGAADGA